DRLVGGDSTAVVDGAAPGRGGERRGCARRPAAAVGRLGVARSERERETDAQDEREDAHGGAPEGGQQHLRNSTLRTRSPDPQSAVRAPNPRATTPHAQRNPNSAARSLGQTPSSATPCRS